MFWSRIESYEQHEICCKNPGNVSPPGATHRGESRFEVSRMNYCACGGKIHPSHRDPHRIRRPAVSLESITASLTSASTGSSDQLYRYQSSCTASGEMGYKHAAISLDDEPKSHATTAAGLPPQRLRLVVHDVWGTG